MTKSKATSIKNDPFKTLYTIVAVLLLIIFCTIMLKYNWFGLLTDNEYGTSFRMKQQLYLPAIFGCLGGFSFILIESLSRPNSTKTHNFSYTKFSFIGTVAGIASVNLLNPTGSVSQIIILALIAGLSGVSYLTRNALVDTSIEKNILNIWDKNTLETLELNEQFKSSAKSKTTEINNATKNIFTNDTNHALEVLKEIEALKEIESQNNT